MSELGFLKPVGDYLDGLVHPSAQQDALTAARHRAFIAPRLLGSLIALAAFPVYLTLRGMPTAIEVAVFGWLIVPILIAYFLSRTGRYEGAHILSSLALTGLVTAVAAKTGGIDSFAAIWLVIVPLEAALSASRRVVATASTVALTAAGVLVLLQVTDILPVAETAASGHAALAALGIISASLYATGLALGAEALARKSVWLRYAEEDRYRLLARNMTDVITRHGPHGAVLFVSPAAEGLFGARVNELRGHGLFERIHVTDRPVYLTALADASARGEAQSAEFRVRREASAASGHVWVEMRCRPLDGTGAPRSEREVVAVMRDVTGRKTQEAALQDARHESECANAAKTRFLATMSHELRTPLNAIIGFSEMIANEETLQLDASRRHEYAQLINESGQHLLSVVNSILDMSKIESGDFEIEPAPFAPAPVIAGCCEMLALKARDSGIELVTQLAPDLPDITADKRAVKQIMYNLLSNAIKFTNRGGRVSVAAHAENGCFVIAVEDSGIGIGETDLARIGLPFFQARSAYDRRHDGTGLGLSIVKGLVELHRGTIDVASELGRGTRITVRLPIEHEPALPAPEDNIARPVFGLDRRAIEPAVRKSA